ncbi:MAG TPA: hypothetical protein VLE93_03205 [Candidatus Saccharimonadales bacterium]|nr:hypothetical protein [Candidatus Saccharimonadales bacterium]
MFAEVLVRRRTRVETLTYAIPAAIIPYIRVGSQVVVSVGRQIVKGVVLKITRVVPRELRSKLKDIQNVDKNALGFSFLQIATIEKLADYYGASLSEIAYHALSFPSPLAAEKAKPSPQKPLFVQAPWPDRLKFYQRIIKKHAGKKRLVFLFAVESFAAEFAKTVGSSANVFFDDLNAAQTKNLNALIATQKPVIIIGGQKWAFFPLQAGDVIVIDQPDHVGLTSQRRPYMSAKQIGLARAATEGVQLVLGADAPSVADYLHQQNSSWQFLRQKLPARELVIFDKTRSADLLLPNFVAELRQAAEKKEKVLVFAASRGWASALYCRECSQVQDCPNCGRPIGLKNERELICLYCGFTGARPVFCSNGHEKLVSLGEGVAQITAVVKKILPTAAVAEVSGEIINLPVAQILVTTEKILSFPSGTDVLSEALKGEVERPPAQYNSLFIAAADQLLAGSSQDGSWHLLSILLALRSRVKNIYIQTRFPDHWVWLAVGTGKLDEFYQRELEERKKYRLPPFGQELKLVGRDKNLERLQKQADEIAEKLEKEFPSATFSAAQPRRIPGQQFELTLQLYRATHFSPAEKHSLRAIFPPSWAIVLD